MGWNKLRKVLLVESCTTDLVEVSRIQLARRLLYNLLMMCTSLCGEIMEVVVVYLMKSRGILAVETFKILTFKKNPREAEWISCCFSWHDTSCCSVWKNGNPAQIDPIFRFWNYRWFHVYHMFLFGNVHFIPRSRQIFLCRRGTAIKYGWTANGWIQGQCDAQKEKRYVCFCWLQISHRLKGVKYNFIFWFGKNSLLPMFRLGWNHQLAYRYNIPWFLRVLYIPGGVGSLPWTVSVCEWWNGDSTNATLQNLYDTPRTVRW